MASEEQTVKFAEKFIETFKRLLKILLQKIYQWIWQWKGGEIDKSVHLELSGWIDFSIKKGHKEARANIRIMNFSPYTIKIDKVSMRITSIENKASVTNKVSLDLELSCNDKIQIPNGRFFTCTVKTDLYSQAQKFKTINSGYANCDYGSIKGYFIRGSKSFFVTNPTVGTFCIAKIYNELANLS